MDPETQALLQYLQGNFGLGAPVPNVNMALPFAEPPPAAAPDFNATFAASGVPNPASMPTEVPPVAAPQVGRPPYSGRTGPSVGETVGPKLGELLASITTGVEGLGQRAVDYMRSRATPPAPLPSTTPVPAIPSLPFYVPPKTDIEAGRVPPDVPAPTYTPQQAAAFDQPATPETAKATVGTPASAGGQSGKLLEALRGVVTPKPPDVQRPIPAREVQPHKIESTIAMLASLGITPKDLMHIPSLGASLRG